MILRRTLPFLSAGAALAAPLAAQPVTVSTTPMGGMVVEVGSGLNAVAINFVTPKTFQGEVTAAADSSISVNSGDLALFTSHYVQVLSGSAAGAIVTVSSLSSGVLVLESPISGLDVGDLVAIRPHFTLSQLQTSPELPTGAIISLYNPSGSVDSFEYLSAADLGLPTGLWADSSFEDASSVPIFPGEGIILSNPGLPVTLLVSGMVSTDPVRVPVGPAFSYFSPLDPTGMGLLGDVFGTVPPDSLVTLFSSQSLGGRQVFEAFDASLFGLGDGVIFGDAFGEDASNVVVSGSYSVVINPPASASVLTLPPAYSE